MKPIDFPYDNGSPKPVRIDRSDDHFEYLKRAHRAYQDARDLLRAARCAFWAGINLATRGQSSHAAGWFGRAQRFADRGPRGNVEHGYLLVPALLECAGERDWKGVAARMPRALPSWAHSVPPYAIGTIAMFWVIERVGAFWG